MEAKCKNNNNNENVIQQAPVEAFLHDVIMAESINRHVHYAAVGYDDP